MRHDRKLAVGTIATAAVLLGGVSDAPQAGQARSSLGGHRPRWSRPAAPALAVRHGHDRNLHPGAAPLAVAREAGPAGASADTGGATAGVEAGNDVEFVTLFY